MQPQNQLIEVASLVDDLFTREHLLVSNGLNSFTPALRFTEAFSQNADEWKEYRDFVIGSAKRQVARDPKFDAWLAWEKQAAQQRYEATGDTSELKLVRLHRRWWRQQAKGRRETFEMLRPYKEEGARLWAAEVAAHSTKLYAEFEARRASRMALYTAVIEQERANLGVSRDQELSSSRSPVYSTTVGRDWKICFRLDEVALAKPAIGPITDVETGEVSSGGVQLHLYLEVRRIAGADGTSTRATPIHFESLFPIGAALFGPRSYSRFIRLKELEALVRIHVKMFLLVSTELWKALLAAADRITHQVNPDDSALN